VGVVCCIPYTQSYRSEEGMPNDFWTGDLALWMLVLLAAIQASAWNMNTHTWQGPGERGGAHCYRFTLVNGTVPRDFRLQVFSWFISPSPLVSHKWQICHQCHWYRRCTLTCECLREFSKKIEMTLMIFSGAWGKMIYEKTWSKKSRDTVPLIRYLCGWGTFWSEFFFHVFIFTSV
jgi:hypothetical protein